jgi:hypothetical protein
MKKKTWKNQQRTMSLKKCPWEELGNHEMAGGSERRRSRRGGNM